MRESKYHAQKVIYDGQRFDSRREAQRYAELRLLERADVIGGLRRQVKYVLIPAQREAPDIGQGAKKPGRLIERELAYIADFVYTQDGKTVVEDCKGFRTEAYKIKRKLMLWVHGIRIKET